MKNFLSLALALFVSTPVVAADLAAPSFLGQPCTTLNCTGPYVGVFMSGNGTNADILGSGLSGSVFAGGGIPGIDAGWQLWNGKLFIAAEVGIGDQLNVGSSINGIGSNETGFMAYQELQVGGTLSALFGSSIAPVTGPTGPTVLSEDLISLYVVPFGIVERSFATGWESGAGAKYALTSHIIADIGYRYINYGSAQVGGLKFNSENVVSFKLNYKF